MTKKKEVFKTEAEIERDGYVNLSVGTQKKLKVRLIGGQFDGIVQEMPEVKARRMIAMGKAESVTGKVKVIEPPDHIMEARNLQKAKEDAKAKAEK